MNCELNFIKMKIGNLPTTNITLASLRLFVVALVVPVVGSAAGASFFSFESADDKQKMYQNQLKAINMENYLNKLCSVDIKYIIV